MDYNDFFWNVFKTHGFTEAYIGYKHFDYKHSGYRYFENLEGQSDI